MKKSKFLGAALAVTMFATTACGLVACDKEAGGLPEDLLPDTGKSYTITFDANGGTLKNITGTTLTTDKSGNLSGTMPTAEKANNTFKGWALTKTATTAAITNATTFTAYTFTDNTTVYAVFAQGNPNPPVEYTITFDYGDGSGTPESMTTTDSKLTSLPIATPPENYKFEGWYTAQNGGGEKKTAPATFTANTPLYAYYTENQSVEYTITFDYGDGSGTPESMTTTDGKLTSLPTATPPENYKFEGWYTAQNGGGEKKTAPATFTANTPLYAYYTENQEPEPETTVVFTFSTGWTDPIKDVHIHIWGADGAYTEWTSNVEADYTGFGGAEMTSIDGGFTFTYTLELNDTIGDIVGLNITFQQENSKWKAAQSTNYEGTFSGGNTYDLAFEDWTTNENGEAINWDTWWVVPFTIKEA